MNIIIGQFKLREETTTTFIQEKKNLRTHIVLPLHPILSGVPQGYVLDPILYNHLFQVASFTDDTGMMASYTKFTRDLSQNCAFKFESKSVSIAFILRRGNCPTVFSKNYNIPQVEDITYFRLIRNLKKTHLDAYS